MTERRKEKFLRVLGARQSSLTIVMEDIHDPHNVSAMLRSADAVGIPEIHLVYRNEEFPKLGKKSSASAVKWVGRHKHTSIEDCYRKLRSDGFRILATHLGAQSSSLYDLNLVQKVALVFGNEHRGVSEEAAHRADGNFQIPMVGMIESLNVSVACAVTLYEAFRQRVSAGMYSAPSMSPDELTRRFKLWMAK